VERIEVRPVKPRTDIIAQRLGIVKPPRWKKRSGKGKGSLLHGLTLARSRYNERARA
jgi:hypothetical protein